MAETTGLPPRKRREAERKGEGLPRRTSPGPATDILGEAAKRGQERGKKSATEEQGKSPLDEGRPEVALPKGDRFAVSHERAFLEDIIAPPDEDGPAEGNGASG